MIEKCSKRRSIEMLRKRCVEFGWPFTPLTWKLVTSSSNACNQVGGRSDGKNRPPCRLSVTTSLLRTLDEDSSFLATRIVDVSGEWHDSESLRTIRIVIIERLKSVLTPDRPQLRSPIIPPDITIFVNNRICKSKSAHAAGSRSNSRIVDRNRLNRIKPRINTRRAKCQTLPPVVSDVI